MSKHSKWAKIKRKKGIADIKKGAAFTKFLNAITVAVREGGGDDPNMNFKLRLAVDAARAENIPKENIERAIERAAGKSAAQSPENVLYEGFGPGGVAIMVEALTDNRNRTVHEIKKIFADHGGTFGSQGAVSWGFARKGVLRLNGNESALDEATELGLIEAGAEDITRDTDTITIATAPEQLAKVKNALEHAGVRVLEADLEWVPTAPAAVLGAEDEERLVELLNALEEHDDVVRVATNATFAA